MSRAMSSAAILSPAAASARITGPLGESRELQPDGPVPLARVGLAVDLHLDSHDAVVVLLQPGQLLLNVTAIPVGDLAVPAGDHYIHVNLPRRRSSCRWVRSLRTGRARESPRALAHSASSVGLHTQTLDVAPWSWKGDTGFSGTHQPHRRAVAATVATRTTSRPASSSARWASRAVEPVVSTSSQTTSRVRPRRRPSSRTARAVARIEPPRLASSLGRVESGLVGHTAAHPEQPPDLDVEPGPPELACRSRGDGVRGVVAARPHRPRPGGDRHQHQRTPPRQLARDRGGQQPRQRHRQPEQPPLLEPEHHRPDGRLVGRRRPRLHQPGRHRGRPRRRRAARQLLAAARTEQPAGPGTAHARPTQQQVDRSVQHGLAHAQSQARATDRACRTGAPLCRTAPRGPAVDRKRTTRASLRLSLRTRVT